MSLCRWAYSEGAIIRPQLTNAASKTLPIPADQNCKDLGFENRYESIEISV